MNSISPTPEKAFPGAMGEGNRVHSALSLVICDPAALCAEAIGALVRKCTSWQVACVTSGTDVALRAARASNARAFLFEARDCSPGAILALVRRIRSAGAGIVPVLLTGHDGARVLRSAMAAGVRACVHKRDSVAALGEALRAAEQGGMYLSATVLSALSATRQRVRHREDRRLAPDLDVIAAYEHIDVTVATAGDQTAAAVNLPASNSLKGVPAPVGTFVGG
jgi:DNA-binding NarL/FixJ family response regulator